MTAPETPPSSPGLCARMYTPSLYTHHTGLEPVEQVAPMAPSSGPSQINLCGSRGCGASTEGRSSCRSGSALPVSNAPPEWDAAGTEPTWASRASHTGLRGQTARLGPFLWARSSAHRVHKGRDLRDCGMGCTQHCRAGQLALTGAEGNSPRLANPKPTGPSRLPEPVCRALRQLSEQAVRKHWGLAPGGSAARTGCSVELGYGNPSLEGTAHPG